MRIPRYPLRSLLVFDFLCAWGGGLAYLVLFNFLVETLQIPRWLASAQLAANWLYGLFGFSLFLSGTKRRFWFATLACMNVGYALFALVMSWSQFRADAPWGGALLFGEGALILGLAGVEFRSLSRVGS